ncbi:MAG: SH3 domain-containing protein [Deltaproteobacteria bacterium]|nr:SH3 domain-containing protein [Deltaproteobacteria bacterium]MBW2661904.1 SH3 domain-containing protein [Deltaproteobacteria bacterium]
MGKRPEKHSNILCPIIIAILLIVCSADAFAERLTIKAPLANIRSGPGTNYDIIWKVGKYYPVDVLEKSGPWYHFSDFEADKGWIHKSLVNKILSVITNKIKCNIRSGPGTKYDILFTVEKGIPFKVIKSKGNWIYIQHADGDRGWIHNSLVW